MIKSRRMRWAGHVARRGEMMGAYRVWVRKTEGTGPLERPSCGWEDNIKMDIQEVGWGSWTDLVQVRDSWRAVVDALIGAIPLCFAII
jgi:hypothetical protein